MRKAYSYIRMSTDTQLKGDSLRRQLEASERFTSENMLELVDSIDGIPLKDIGVSGFRGENSKKGVLSIFIEHLESGKIESNSVLLIESLDRLSRDDILSALGQFMKILSFDIEIITLADNQKYTKQNINNNPTQLYISLGVMFRANEESEIKSKRIRAAWDNKRANASQKPVTSIAPAWLKLSENRDKFEIVEERATVVRKIFDLCANTCGLWAITQYLNQQKIPKFGNSKLWNRSYIRKLLYNRAVLGEYQPHTTKNGKRFPIGEPINNYFPQIVTTQLFHQASAAIDSRTIKGSGRKGATFSNLFSGLIYCRSCGSKMSLKNRGNINKGGKTIICNNKLLGGGCKMPEWKLTSLEKSVFRHLREVNFSELIGKKSETTDIEHDITALKNQLKEKELAIENLINLITVSLLAETSKIRLTNRLNTIDTEIADLKLLINKQEYKLIEVNAQNEAISKEDIKKTILLIDEKSEDYYFRSSLHQLLIRAIKRIELIIENNVFSPWEFSEEDNIVKDFYIKYPLQIKIPLADLIKKEDFKALWLSYEKRIQIEYKTGIVRQILVGSDISFSNKSLSTNTN